MILRRDFRVAKCLTTSSLRFDLVYEPTLSVASVGVEEAGVEESGMWALLTVRVGVH